MRLKKVTFVPINGAIAMLSLVKCPSKYSKPSCWFSGASKLSGVWMAMFFLMTTIVESWGQTTYDWLNTAPDGNWRQGASGARWNPGGLYDEPPYGIIRFNNNHQLAMTNNVAGSYSQFQIVFGSSNTSSRTIAVISGNSVQFFDFSGIWPRITNLSTALHTINFPIFIGSGGTYNLELMANNGPLQFGDIIGTNGKILNIYGDNAAVDGTNRYIKLNAAVTGTGLLKVAQFGVARLSAANTYTGNTEIDNGELWVESGGGIGSSAPIYVGNGGATTSTAKLWLSNATGGTTLANNIVVNQGNATAREIGGLNTSGTHTFSGNITNNSTNGINLNALNTNGTTVFLGIISGANAVNKAGAGTVLLSGQNTYTGATTISAGTAKLGANGGPTTSPLGTTASGTTVANGAVLDLNGYSVGTSEALTLNGTGISNVGALANNPASTTNVTYSGLITLGSAASMEANNGAINLTNTGIITGTGFGLTLGGASGGSLASIIGTGGGSLTKQGSGTWVLSGASTYTGATTINAGLLQLSGGTNRLPITSALTLANTIGAALDLNSQNQTFGSLSGGGSSGGNIILGTATLGINSGTNTTYAGNIAGAGGITKQGTGTLALSGTNTFTGITTISAGILAINNANAWPATSNIALDGGTLRFGGVSGASLGSTTSAGTLTLQSNSTINMGTATNYSVSFGTSELVSWNLAATLTITSWTPSSGRVIKFESETSLTTDQLARINFDNYGIGAKLVLVGTEYELRPTLLYVTLPSGSGNFTAAGSWLNSDRPIVGDGTAAIYVQPGYTLNQNTDYNLYSAEIGGTLAMGSRTVNIFTGGQFQNDGVVIITSGTLNIASGAALNHNGSFTMTGASNINMATGSTINHTGSPTYSAAGNINFAGTGTITGSATLPYVFIEGAVDFGSASTIGNGSALTINAGGSVNTNAPAYDIGSTLIYNSGGTYGRNTEWSATTGAGYPYNVQVGNGVNTILDLGNGGTGTARFCAGSLTILAGSTLTMNNAGNIMTAPLHVAGSVTINGSLVLSSIAPGDLYVGGDYIEAAGTVLAANGRAVFFNGGTTTNQTITKTGTGNIHFPYMIVEKTNNGNVQLSTGTNVVLSSTTNNTGLYVLQILNGNIDLNDGTLTLTGTVPNSNNVRVGGGSQRRIFTTTGTGDFVVNGTFTAGSPNMNVSAAAAGSSLIFDNSVKITTSVGLDFGPSGMSLINATLQLNTNGFVINNAPDYGNSSILIYNNGPAGYNRNYEWRSTSGAGFPNNIIVANNTPVSLNTIAAPADLGCSGNLTIDAGSSLNMDAMAYDLFVAGNVNINGGLTLSTSTGTTGDLRLTGNWTRGSGGTFTQNAGIVYFTGTTASQLTAPAAGEAFTKLYMLKTGSGNLTLNSPVLVNTELNFGGGLINTTSSNLLTMASAAAIGGAPGSSNYINGPLRRYIFAADALLFPIGKSAASNPYRPITFAPAASTTGTLDYFTATFFNANPPAGFMSGPNLQGMLKNQYWQLDRSGAANGTVKIDYVAPSGTGNWLDTYTGLDAVDPADPVNTVQIAKRSSDDDGLLLRPWSFTYSGEPASTDFYTPYNVSKAPLFTDLVNSFSYFGFGYSFSSLLPAKLLSFDGKMINADGSLSWKVTNTEDLASFELQYSSNGRNFIKLASIPFNGNTLYSHLHKNIPTGANYYKLCVKNKNGTSYYSKTILLVADKLQTQIISLATSTYNNVVLLKIVSASKQDVQAVVTDASGRRINEFKSVLEAGINQWHLNTKILSTGIYFVTVQTSDKTRQTFRFAKL